MKATVYPKWKYHAEKAALIVHSAEEEAALGEGWAETPAAFEKSAVKVEGPAPSNGTTPVKLNKPGRKPKVVAQEALA